MEPLSKSLRDWLIACKLCTRADLRRCKPRVRQFARDVPAFDSVWIDALIHNRKLTRFQAKVLGSGTPHALKIGPWVLVDQLGSGASATFLAREHGSNRKAVLKRIRPDENEYESAMAALQQLVAGGKDQTEPSLALPHSCIPAHQELITISPYRRGPTLKEFLVRRGRLSADVVSAMLHQLIAGLATLEARGIVHGDVQLKNVRISKRGQASLVDAGVRPALRPVLNIHDRRGPDEYDGIAPELIGTGNLADVRSEFYALGCLAWHLLAGRPPFPTGDPLAKLQAHQTRRIPDVRDIAPDTPRELAETLLAFTDPDPDRRPSSFQEFGNRWGSARRVHRRQLARLSRSFQSGIPHVPAMRWQAESNPWPMIAASTLLLSAASLALMDAGAYSHLLSIPGRLGTLVESTREVAKEEATARETQPVGKTLPAPNAEGVIELKDGGPYRLDSLDVVGPLTIRGNAATPATIVINDKNTRLSAVAIQLENLVLQSRQSSSSLLELHAQSLTVKNCRFEWTGHGLRWKHDGQASATSGRLVCENTHILGEGPFLEILGEPASVALRNCLKTGAGVLIRVEGSKQASRQTEVALSRLTLRGAGGLLELSGISRASSNNWRIQAGECVFDLEAGGLLIQSQGRSSDQFLRTLSVQGRQCLLSPHSGVAGWKVADGDDYQSVDGTELNIEGLVFAEMKFHGPASARPIDSQLESWQGPRFSTQVPGIDPAALPKAE